MVNRLNMLLKKNFPINLSGIWEIIVFKHNSKVTSVFYNDRYYINYHEKFKTKVYTQSNSVAVCNDGRDFALKTLATFLKKNITYFNNIKYNKINYAGKGYRIYIKKKYFMYPNLGISHKIYIYSFTSVIKTFSRHSVLFLSTNNRTLTNFIKKLVMIRKWNIFTQRGIRFVKQPVYKKIGKVSSY